VKSALVINGTSLTVDVEARMSLADLVRDELGLTGTKLGCESGSCGSCVVSLDGRPTLSCLQLAVCCEGLRITTIEGFSDDSLMHRIKAAFHSEHALQCGFCTPGLLVLAHALITSGRDFDERTLREELRGNLCRCTGYVGIIRAIMNCRSAQPSP